MHNGRRTIECFGSRLQTKFGRLHSEWLSSLLLIINYTLKNAWKTNHKLHFTVNKFTFRWKTFEYYSLKKNVPGVILYIKIAQHVEGSKEKILRHYAFWWKIHLLKWRLLPLLYGMKRIQQVVYQKIFHPIFSNRISLYSCRFETTFLI